MNKEAIQTMQEVNLPVKLTEGALTEIRHLIQVEGVTTKKGLRLGVKGGGCAGFTYVLEFDKPGIGDNVYEVEDLKIIINRSEEIYLFGTLLDFDRGLANRGFVFNNPNAESTCGCGTSFSA